MSSLKFSTTSCSLKKNFALCAVHLPIVFTFSTSPSSLSDPNMLRTFVLRDLSGLLPSNLVFCSSVVSYSSGSLVSSPARSIFEATQIYLWGIDIGDTSLCRRYFSKRYAHWLLLLLSIIFGRFALIFHCIPISAYPCVTSQRIWYPAV